MKFKRFIAILAAVAVLAANLTAAMTANAAQMPSVEESGAAKLTYYFYNSWEDGTPDAYWWTPSAPADWPGVVMTAAPDIGKNIYKIDAPAETTYIIFSLNFGTGSSKYYQTSNINITYEATEMNNVGNMVFVPDFDPSVDSYGDINRYDGIWYSLDPSSPDYYRTGSATYKYHMKNNTDTEQTTVPVYDSTIVAGEPSSKPDIVEYDGEGKTIYFRPDEEQFSSSSRILFFVWDETSGLYASKDGWTNDSTWGSRKKIGGTKVEVNGETLFESYPFTIPEGHDVFLIVHIATTNCQTCNLIINSEAFGDTVYITGNLIENPIDPSQQYIEAAFEKTDKCGAEKVITSTCKVVGKVERSSVNYTNELARKINFYLIEDGDKTNWTYSNVQKVMSDLNLNPNEVWKTYYTNYGEDEEAKAVILGENADTYTDKDLLTDTDKYFDTDTSVNVDTDSSIQIDTDNNPDTDTSVEVDTDSKTHSDIDTDTVVEIDTDSSTLIDTDMHSDTDTAVDISTDNTTYSDTDTHSDTDTAVEIDTDSSTPIDTDKHSNTDTNTAADVDTDSSTQIDSDKYISTDTAADIDTDSSTPIDTDTNNSTDTAVDNDTESDTRIDSDSDKSADSEKNTDTDNSSDAANAADFDYAILPDNTVKITHYNGSAYKLVFPSKIDGKNVSTIGSMVLVTETYKTDKNGDSRRVYKHAFIGRIILPDTVTTIDPLAFSQCTSLEEITIPRSVTSIGGKAFQNSSNAQIICYSGSAAETYAKENELDYRLLDGNENANPLKEVLCGDIDYDGTITSSDALLILRASLSPESLNSESFKIADVNEDGLVESYDALQVLRFGLGYTAQGCKIGEMITV